MVTFNQRVVKMSSEAFMKSKLCPCILVVVSMAAFAPLAFAEDRATLLGLGQFEQAPATHPAEGFATDGDVRPIYFDGLPYRGKQTRVFGWLGVPANATPQAKVPAVVLVHGGGGTAFKEWVKRWNAQGFAAIAIATEGQTDVRKQSDVRGDNWERHEWAGPARDGIFGDAHEPLADQWMYHAVADTMLARLLLVSLPEVDAVKTGIMGVSWGGIITKLGRQGLLLGPLFILLFLLLGIGTWIVKPYTANTQSNAVTEGPIRDIQEQSSPEPATTERVRESVDRKEFCGLQTARRNDGRGSIQR